MTLQEDEIATAARDRRSLGSRLGLGVFVLAAAGALGFGIHSGIRTRTEASEELARATDQAATPVVKVVHPKLASPIAEIILPGNTQAFIDSPIYARTSGYLAHWYFDIGARVKKGDLLADIETPEIDQQLQQAQAQLETAQANYDLAKTTADRWQWLLKTNSVSKQETDQAVANHGRAKGRGGFERGQCAPLAATAILRESLRAFDGVITARSTDIGALIDAGSAAQGKELFHLAAIIDSARVRAGSGSVFERRAARREGYADARRISRALVSRKAGAKFECIDPASRTLLVEVDVDNPDRLLLPGAYTSVHLKLPAAVRSVTIPANTLLFRREGLRVGVVRGGRANLVPVAIGRDYGASVEIVSGLRPSDSIILDPSDSLESGAPVRVEGGSAQ